MVRETASETTAVPRNHNANYSAGGPLLSGRVVDKETRNIAQPGNNITHADHVSLAETSTGCAIQRRKTLMRSTPVHKNEKVRTKQKVERPYHAGQKTTSRNTRPQL